MVADCARSGTGDVDLLVATLDERTTTVRYVITGGTGGPRSGTLALDEGFAQVTLRGFARDAYTLQLFEGDATTSSSESTFRVLGCL